MHQVSTTCANLDSLLGGVDLTLSVLIDCDNVEGVLVSENTDPKLLLLSWLEYGPYTGRGGGSPGRFQGSFDVDEQVESILFSLLAGLGALQIDKRVSTASRSTESSTTEFGLSMSALLAWP